jgi:hypothetical protein
VWWAYVKLALLGFRYTKIRNTQLDFNLTLNMFYLSIEYKLHLNCPTVVIINQAFTCQLLVVSYTQTYQVVLNFGDGEIQTHSLSNQTLSISKTYTKTGSYVINAHAVGQNMNIDPWITVTDIIGFDGQQFTLNCPVANTFLFLTNVFFGHRAINCKDTLAPSVIKTHCDNQASCSITVGSNPTLVDACPYTLKYLSLNYECRGNLKFILF